MNQNAISILVATSILTLAVPQVAADGPPILTCEVNVGALVQQLDVCKDVTEGAAACAAGDPELPCDPNPEPRIQIPNSCEFGCEAQPFVEVAVDGTIEVPDVYLVECLVEVEGIPITLRVPALNEDAACPIASMETGDVLPLVTPDPDRPGVEPTTFLNVGTCEFMLGAELYGEPIGFAEPTPIPCAFPM